VNQLEQIFEPVTPILLDQIDSYYQLVQCPASDVLSMKQRSNEQNVKVRKSQRNLETRSVVQVVAQKRLQDLAGAVRGSDQWKSFRDPSGDHH
jgi:hypothetical protein